MQSDELTQIEELHYHFARLFDVIEKAVSHTRGRYAVDDVWKQIESGHAQLWYGEDSMIVTEILQTPQVRSILHFFLVGGNREELLRMYPLIIEWGKAQGCTRASGVGRAGFSRVAFLQEDGWAPVGVLYEKELQNGRRQGEGSDPDPNDHP